MREGPLHAAVELLLAQAGDRLEVRVGMIKIIEPAGKRGRTPLHRRPPDTALPTRASRSERPCPAMRGDPGGEPGRRLREERAVADAVLGLDRIARVDLGSVAE
jgi:hypothetical protein